MADNLNGLFGDYSPTPDPKYTQTPRQGLSSLGIKVNYAAGCNNTDPKCMDYDTTSLKQAVTGADLVIVCLGTGIVTTHLKKKKGQFLFLSSSHCLCS